MHAFPVPREMIRPVKSSARRLVGTQCRVGCEGCFKMGGCWSVFGFVGKCQCFKSDAGGYRKPVEGAWQWCCVGEFKEVENELCSCFLDQQQRLNGTQRQICLESNLKMKRDGTSMEMACVDGNGRILLVW